MGLFKGSTACFSESDSQCRDHPNQASCSTDWQAKLSLFSPFLWYTQLLLAFLFNSCLPLPPCDIIKTGGGMLFSCGEICVFIGHILH